MGTFICGPLLAYFYLFFEAIGGMRSVVYTDSVQSAIMVLVFIAVPFVILIDYGIQPPFRVKWKVRRHGQSAQTRLGCLGMERINWNNGKIAARKYIADNIKGTPSTITNMNDLLFWISGLCFAIHPHLAAVLSAKSDKG